MALYRGAEANRRARRYVPRNDANDNKEKTKRGEAMTISREDARKQIRDKLEDYLQAQGINTGSLFNCLNPEHPDLHPSMGIDKTGANAPQAHCFSCGAKYDTLDLIGMDYNLTSYDDQLDKAAAIFGIDIEPRKHGSTPKAAEVFQPVNGYQNQAKTEQTSTFKPVQRDNIGELPDTPVIDFTPEVLAAHEELASYPTARAYFKSRGLSDALIEEYKLGYHNAGHNDLLKAHPDNLCKSRKDYLYRYVLPYPGVDGRYTYFITEIVARDQVDDYNRKYRKINKNETSLAAPLFNERYLMKDAPPVIFICEGIYDALSAEEVGSKAIAFVGTGHRRFLQLCKKYRPDTVFVISLDNDGSGKSAAEKVADGLKTLGLPFITRAPEGGKDFNEMLTGYLAGFRNFINQATADALEVKEAYDHEAEAQEEESKREYLQTSVAYHLQEFVDGIADSVNTPYYPTGFTKLDEVLDGGLYEGLYLIGAISSLGKTTFALQIADHIAASGQDVLIFSLEMARSELMAKSISRLTAINALELDGSTRNAKTVRGITVGKRYEMYSPTERQLIEKSIMSYGEYADHLYIHEGVGDIGAEQIKEVVDRHIHYTGARPVVLIDYVQILAPFDPRSTDKQNTDKAVLELKRMSRDYKIPVLGVASFNRENYEKKVSLAALKESGSLEYGSDVVLGLQLRGTGSKEFDVDAAKAMNPREIELKVLKNRNGKTGSTLNYSYYPMFNYFTEV